MLAGPGLGDDAGLPHTFCKENLPESVVDLMRARVVELISFEVDLGAAERLGETLGKVQRAGSARVVGGIVVKVPLEFGRLSRLGVRRFKVQNQRHQGFSNETASEQAEVALLVWATSVGF